MSARRIVVMVALAATAMVALLAPPATATAGTVRPCATKVDGKGVYPFKTSCKTAVRVAQAGLEGKGPTTPSGRDGLRFGSWGCTLTQGLLFCSIPAFAPLSKAKQAVEAGAVPRSSSGVTTSPTATSTPTTAPSAAAPSTADPCVFVPGGASSCSSTVPTVSVDFLNQSSTVGCAFDVAVDWGDGSPAQQVAEPGGEPGPTYLASHTYSSAGNYTIATSGTVASGHCTISGTQFGYTQLATATPGTAVPVLGQSVLLTPSSGTVSYRSPGSAGFALLTGAVLVPIGTDVDTTAGTVTVTAASGATPATEDALVYDGFFTIQQATDAPYKVTFTLSEPLTGCGGSGSAESAQLRAVGPAARSKAKKPAKQRHLWAQDAGGAFGTAGAYVSTAVEGTKWLTTDTCTSSTVTVTEGLVAVLDNVSGQTVVVSANHRYKATKSERAAGPLAAINSYWAAIGAHEFRTAYGYVDHGGPGNEAAFSRSENQEGVESAVFRGKVTAQSGGDATVRVLSLETHDRQFGCRSWNGHYAMRRHGNRWLIAAAAITPHTC